MSNQVFSNSFNGSTQYRPSTANVDTLTLTKNNPAVPGVSPAYGNTLKLTDGRGFPIRFGQLNGVDAPINGGITNYSALQNPRTVPYWSFGSDTALQDGGTLLYSKVDNIISVNAAIPMNITNKPGSPNGVTTLAMAVRIWNANGSIDRTVCYDGFQSGIYGATGVGVTLASTASIPFSVVGTFHVAAGQFLGVVAIASTISWGARNVEVDIKDFLSPETTTPGFTSLVQMPCVCEFIKM